MGKQQRRKREDAVGLLRAKVISVLESHPTIVDGYRGGYVGQVSEVQLESSRLVAQVWVHARDPAASRALVDDRCLSIAHALVTLDRARPEEIFAAIPKRALAVPPSYIVLAPRLVPPYPEEGDWRVVRHDPSHREWALSEFALKVEWSRHNPHPVGWDFRSQFLRRTYVREDVVDDEGRDDEGEEDGDE